MRKVKLWTGLGVAAVSTALIAENVLAAEKAEQFKAKSMLVAQSGEGGEGGEGGRAAKAHDDAEFLSDLGMIEGHLAVGVALYKLGDKNSTVHMKHPKDEIYKDLEPALKARNLPGFENELEALATAVEAGKPVADVEALHAKLSEAISAARNAEKETSAIVTAVHHLVRDAADEYAEGVKDGKVTNAKEYQDAWGFVEVAHRMMAGLPAEGRAKNRQAIAEIETEFDKLKPAWPELTGKEPVAADSTLLPAAAARIELAASSIK